MSVEDYEQTVNNHRLLKLIELCIDHNNSVSESHPERRIDINKYTTAEDLIFNLWYHNIDVGVLGFGYPYDEILKDWVPNDYEFPFERSTGYLTYVHSDRIPGFLFYSLLLPKNHGNYYPMDKAQEIEMLHRNISVFNVFWTNLGKEPIEDYHELRKILSSNVLTKIELCCLLWECENESLFNSPLSVDDCIDGL